MNKGIVYAVSHPTWMDACLVSANSAAQHMPDVAREVYVTRAVADVLQDGWQTRFTQVVVLDDAKHFHRPRFDAMLETALDQAIFIDTDTFFVEPVYELFDMLEQFDIAAMAAPQYLHPTGLEQGIFDMLPPVSEAVPEWNGGVIVARSTPGVRKTIEQWSVMFEKCMEKGYRMDQASLRAALVHSKLRIATLPNNYNFRANLPQIVTRSVKILHAHGDLPEIAKTINASTAIRPYTPDKRLIHGQFPKGFTAASMAFFKKSAS